MRKRKAPDRGSSLARGKKVPSGGLPERKPKKRHGQWRRFTGRSKRTPDPPPGKPRYGKIARKDTKQSLWSLTIGVWVQLPPALKRASQGNPGARRYLGASEKKFLAKQALLTKEDRLRHFDVRFEILSRLSRYEDTRRLALYKMMGHTDHCEKWKERLATNVRDVARKCGVSTKRRY